MRDIFAGIVLGVGYFTRIPLPFKVQRLNKRIYRFLALTLPLSGVLLGGLTILFYTRLVAAANPWFVALLASVLYLFMYGFLHLEAVADIADAGYGGHGGKDRYEILKDPHIGAIGAMWVFVLVLVKIAAMVLLLHEKYYLALLSVSGVSRLTAVWLLAYSRLHEHSRFARELQEAVRTTDVALLTFLFFVLTAAAGFFWIVPFAAVVAFGLYRHLMKEFGFINGDGLGFVIEVVEVVLLTLLVFVVT